jgi:hypothetical protein
MEHLLNHFYAMDYRASQVKHPKKEAFHSIKPVLCNRNRFLNLSPVSLKGSSGQTGRAISR